MEAVRYATVSSPDPPLNQILMNHEPFNITEALKNQISGQRYR